MSYLPVNPVIESRDLFIARIKDELLMLLFEDLADDGINLNGINDFESMYAVWFFSHQNAWTIDRFYDRLRYLHRQLSKWSEVTAAKNSHLPQTLLTFHVRRSGDHFQIFDVPDVVWPIDLPLCS